MAIFRETNRDITLTEAHDVAIVTLQNDANANAIDLPFCEDLLGVLERIRTLGKHRAVVLRATGRIFSAGGHLTQILGGLDRGDGFIESLIDALHAAILAIRRLPMPVIASVQGAAAGAGFSLAMACDFVAASRSARFVVGYEALGTSSDGGLSMHLTRRLGPARALEVLLLKGALSAEEAASLGLVQCVSEPSSLEADAMAMANKLAALPEASVCEMKQLVHEASTNLLEQQLDREKQAFLRCASTAEFYQRVAAFVKRPA